MHEQISAQIWIVFFFLFLAWKLSSQRIYSAKVKRFLIGIFRLFLFLFRHTIHVKRRLGIIWWGMAMASKTLLLKSNNWMTLWRCVLFSDGMNKLMEIFLEKFLKFIQHEVIYVRWMHFFLLQVAKEQGAVFVRDIWSETDEFGTVRFATVKTVSILENAFATLTFSKLQRVQLIRFSVIFSKILGQKLLSESILFSWLNFFFFWLHKSGRSWINFCLSFCLSVCLFV